MFLNWFCYLSTSSLKSMFFFAKQASSICMTSTVNEMFKSKRLFFLLIVFSIKNYVASEENSSFFESCCNLHKLYIAKIRQIPINAYHVKMSFWQLVSIEKGHASATLTCLWRHMLLSNHQSNRFSFLLSVAVSSLPPSIREELSLIEEVYTTAKEPKKHIYLLNK